MTDRLLNVLICIGMLVSAANTQAADSPWVKPPSKAMLAETPGLVHETFESVSMKTTVGYSVVLPASYRTSQKRFPVIYWLHGGGGNESSSLFTAKAWQDLYKTKQIREVILVYPNGFRSGYMDHHDGKVMNESMIIRELIPRIDQRYRTIALRSGRAAHGFSMGASGALKFAIKYPELFCSAVAYGGGAIDLANSKNQFIIDILQRNLNSDPQLIRQNSSYYFLKKNYQVLRQKNLRVLMICGEKDSWKESAVKFQDVLEQKRISSQLKLIPDVGHDLMGLYKVKGASAALFQDRIFREGSSEAESSVKN